MKVLKTYEEIKEAVEKCIKKHAIQEDKIEVRGDSGMATIQDFCSFLFDLRMDSELSMEEEIINIVDLIREDVLTVIQVEDDIFIAVESIPIE